MKNKLKARLPKFNFILGGALFLLSSLSFFESGQIPQAILFLVLGLVNLTLLRFQGRNPTWVNLLVLGLNALGAAVVALDYQAKDASAIHLVWWLAAGLYLVSIGVHYRKQRQNALSRPE
ncbi:MAG: hypothetical protein AAFY48_23040 [Bacteroidota bacterium]